MSILSIIIFITILAFLGLVISKTIQLIAKFKVLAKISLNLEVIEIFEQIQKNYIYSSSFFQVNERNSNIFICFAIKKLEKKQRKIEYAIDIVCSNFHLCKERNTTSSTWLLSPKSFESERKYLTIKVDYLELLIEKLKLENDELEQSIS